VLCIESRGERWNNAKRAMQKDPSRILLFVVLGAVYLVGMSILTMTDLFRHWFRRQPA
jgi:hypothetical protein